MGKSSSKQKRQKGEYESSFIDEPQRSIRSRSLDRKMAPIMKMTYPHLEIGVWLDVLELRQYEENFKPFVGVEELMHYTEADVKKLGITKSAHRARIASSLVALRDKAVRLRGGTSLSVRLRHNQRFSMGVVRDTAKCSEEKPLYEFLSVGDSRTKQTKSLDDLLGMDPSASQSSENGAPPPETLALRRALEYELSLDSRDLRSHAWYHGPIPRTRAEEIVQNEGDFLIRDCVSQPGNYVLTCKSRGPILHFVINKILIQPETVYERAQYQFEDDAYDTVPDLITFYVGSGKAISMASGARIQSPCNRAYPLSFYASKYGNVKPPTFNGGAGGGPMCGSPLNSPSMINAGFSRFNPYNQQHQTSQALGNYNSYRTISPMSSPPRTKRDNPPKLPSKKQMRSHSLTPIQPPPNNSGSGDKYCSADGVCRGPNNGTESNQSTLTRNTQESRLQKGSVEKCNSADGMIQKTNGEGNHVMTRSTEEKSASADGVVTQQSHHHQPHPKITTRTTGRAAGSADLKFSTNSLSRLGGHQQNSNNGGSLHRLIHTSRPSSLNRESSESTMLSPCIERRRVDGEHPHGVCDEPSDSSPSPPPKPIRTATTPSSLFRNDSSVSAKDLPIENGPLNRVVSYHASGSDSGNGSGDSAQSSAAGDALDGSGLPAGVHRGGVIIKNPRYVSNSASSATLKSYADIDYAAVEQMLLDMDVPPLVLPSRFDLDNFNTLLLPSLENKPLDNGALNTFRMMLCETGPRVLANHLTRLDIRLILGDPADNNDTQDPLECTGIELIGLQHGERFRLDLLERTECVKLLVAVTVLTCNCDDERADTLNKWIQVAVDTKTALGNLFGFCSIMLGLCMPQIQKLEAAWHILRQRYTDSAFNFEAKLRPTLKSMNDCSNPQAPNTTVPHLLPYILLRDRGIEDILGLTPVTSTLASSCVTPWETSATDFGMTILFNHLDSVRNFARNLSLYQRNAQIVMADSSSRLDELLEDAFRTEFHMKFLWGSKGALATAAERHTKMEQLLTLMAEKHFSNDTSSSVHHGTAV